MHAQVYCVLVGLTVVHYTYACIYYNVSYASLMNKGQDVLE